MWTITINHNLPLLQEAYQHSYVVCDTTLPFPSLLAESYVLGSLEEQALVHIRPENLLQAINVAIYTRKIPARSFLSLFETTFSIMAYEALKRGWNSFFFDTPSLVTARLAQKLSEGVVSFSKVYDGYYVCSGSLPASLLEQRAIKKEEHSIEYNPTNGEISFSYFSTIDPLDLVKRLLKNIEERQWLSIEFIAREEEVAEYAYSLGFNVLRLERGWLCTFR